MDGDLEEFSVCIFESMHIYIQKGVFLNDNYKTLMKIIFTLSILTDACSLGDVISCAYKFVHVILEHYHRSTVFVVDSCGSYDSDFEDCKNS